MANHSNILAWKINGWRSLEGCTVHGVAKGRTRLSYFTSLLTTKLFLMAETELAMFWHKEKDQYLIY